MKKQYNVPKAEKVEFSYEQNVVASGNTNGYFKCGHWEGNYEGYNAKCACRWVWG